jgi:hypothetical protein
METNGAGHQDEASKLALTHFAVSLTIAVNLTFQTDLVHRAGRTRNSTHSKMLSNQRIHKSTPSGITLVIEVARLEALVASRAHRTGPVAAKVLTSLSR